MLRAKRLRLSALLPLLLLAFLAGGWGGSAQGRVADAAASAWTLSESPIAPDGAEVSVVHGYHGEALRPAQQPLSIAARPTGDGADGRHGEIRLEGALPHASGLSFIQSKAILKQRLYTLLTRAEWQQRLALYPKHGFW